MRKKQYTQIGLTGFFLVLCFGLVLGLVLKSNTTQTQKVQDASVLQTVTSTTTGVATSSLKEDKEDTETQAVVYSKSASLIVSGEEFVIQSTGQTTVYDAMNSLTAEGKMTFEGKNYPGLGFFVTQINSLQSGDGKNLMYYINGVEASVGVSSYIVQEGDIIEWKLK